MTEKQIYDLQIDEYFKKLIPPLATNEQKQLEENIVKNGCSEPLCVWGNTIVDGHNRYNICTRLQIPFYIQQIDFNNREEAIVWICANQLGRRNISGETRRYLIGKRYETEKILGTRNYSGKNQHSENEVNATIYHKSQAQGNRGLTAERIGEEYNIAQATVRKYAYYAKTIDNLSKKEPELISDVLSGKVKISYENIAKLSKKLPTTVNNVKKQLSNNSNFVSYSKARRIIPARTTKPTIKDMPAYDPDAEISSLALTIPSWISSINRTLSMADFNKASNNAKRKLQNELKNLESTVNVMLLATEEK